MKLQVKNINKSYNSIKVLDNISLELSKNEIISILGTSGIGKTTLFNIISGLELPNSGNIILIEDDNKLIKNITGQVGNVSYMFQKDLFLDNKTILDNVILPLRIRGFKKNNARLFAKTFFKQFGILGIEDKYPSQVSGVMKQRAALLRTYLMKTSIMLLDEPFNAIDCITKFNMYKWYLDISEKIKMSSLIITHDIDEAILLSDQIYLMQGSPATITKRINIENKGNISDFYCSNKFIKLKQEILALLK